VCLCRCLCLCLCRCLCMCLCRLSFYLSIYLSVWPGLVWSVCLSACVFLALLLMLPHRVCTHRMSWHHLAQNHHMLSGLEPVPSRCSWHWFEIIWGLIWLGLKHVKVDLLVWPFGWLAGWDRWFFREWVVGTSGLGWLFWSSVFRLGLGIVRG
jgi:hypothetical protein